MQIASFKIIVVNIIYIIFLPFIISGIITRVKSLWSGRKGAPILQSLYDFLKLLKKSEVISNSSSNIFRLAPAMILSSIFCAALFIPFGVKKSILTMSGDFIVFIFLFGLSKFFLTLSALDTASSFEGMGASRESALTIFGEPAFFTLFAVIAYMTTADNFVQFFEFSKLANSSFDGLIIIMISAAFFIMLIVESCRVPFDDPNTHLELTMIHEVMILDNSGVNLAIMQYAANLKMTIFAAIISNFITPASLSNLQYLVVFTVIIFICAIIVGAIESLEARMRLAFNQQLTMSALAIAVFVCALTIIKYSGGLQ